MSQIQLQEPSSAILDDLVVDGNSGSASPAADVLNIVGVGSVSTSASGNTVTIAVSDSGFTWNVVTSANNIVSIVKDNGYIPKGASQVVFALPVTAAVGDTFKITGYGNLWTLTQNAGQSVTLGTQSSTPGVTGSVTAMQVKDCIELLCVTANTEFQIISSTGNVLFA